MAIFETKGTNEDAAFINASESQISFNRDNLTVEEKRELLKQMLEQKKIGSSASPNPTMFQSPNAQPAVAAAEQEVPVSSAQSRLWLFDRMQGASATYNLKFAYILQGFLDVALLERALNSVMVRHETLRTRFCLKGETLYQVIRPEQVLKLSLIDLRYLNHEKGEASARILIDQEAATSFNLEKGPLMRAYLIRLCDAHIFMTSVHHIISDGWSMGIFVRDFVAYYKAFLMGVPTGLVPLNVQFQDFCKAQRQPQSQEQVENDLVYWRQQLEGAPAMLELPTDFPRPILQTLNGTKHNFTIPAELTSRIQEISRKNRSTLFITLLSAYAAVLARYSGQDDILVASPHANRHDKQAHNQIGFFITTMVLRLKMHHNPSFTDLIQSARKVAAGAFSHLHLPFERLVQELVRDRRTHYQPFSQVVFVLQNAAEENFTLPLVEVNRLPMESDTAKFDLQLSLTSEHQGLRGFIEYNTDLFRQETVANLSRHLVNLLSNGVEEPARAIMSLPILGREEREQVLFQWNDTSWPVAGSRLMHSAFEGRAASDPNALAVLFGEQRLSYGEVNLQANQLARLLRSLGVGRGSLVAVFLDRCAEMVPALLGVLKCGAAYVPIETHLPPARISQLLSSLNIHMVLTQSHYCGSLGSHHQNFPKLRNLVCLDKNPEGAVGMLTVYGPEQAAGFNGEDLNLDVSPHDMAYIIFTSGSTGQPKGVMLSHEPVTNLIDWVNRTYQVNERDRVLFVTSLSFDLSVYDVFGLLSCGGSIRVASGEDLRDPTRLLSLLHTEAITFWDSAPAALLQVAAFVEPGQAGNEHLRLVFLSGDWIPLSLPPRIRGGFPGAKVVALGGATEATIWSNFFSADVIEPEWVSVPYGNPIQNAAYYTLNRNLEPTPKRVSGDLFIGGDVLCMGYMNAPKLTAWKFVPDPFSKQPGARIYRTGDHARWWYQGYLEFLGRSDHQVKIRGFRVECGEVEGVLASREDIAVAVVQPRDYGPQDKRLIAYVVPESNCSLDMEVLREFLKAKLPEYMVPFAFVSLEQMPITANGKLDRNALPEPDQQVHQVHYVAPGNDVETKLVAIWQEVLSLKRVGIHDNFFDLGGHSLLLVRMHKKMLTDLPGCNLTVVDLFKYASVSEQAEYLTSQSPPTEVNLEDDKRGLNKKAAFQRMKKRRAMNV